MQHSMKPKWTIVLLLVVVFAGDGLAQRSGSAGGGGMGQSQSQSQSQDQYRPGTQPAIRVTSKMVQLSVIVHDKNGNPVSGLKKEDFKLYDQGQLQKVAFFSEQTNLLHTPVATSANLPNSQRAYSNKYEQDDSFSGSVTVILLDKLNTWAWDQNKALHSGMPLNLACRLR